MVDINDKGKEIPVTEWGYYFAVYGDTPVIENNYTNESLSMKDLYQIFRSRFLAESTLGKDL